MATSRNNTPQSHVAVNMRAVAERAGVALSSVSRVLSGHPDVSLVMRNRVLDAIAALGYQPNLLARSLRQGTSNTVGFVVGDISNPLMSEIALGAETVLRHSGRSMLLVNSGGDADVDAHHIAYLAQRQVDGLLLSLADETWAPTLRALEDHGLAYVLIDREISGSSAVLSDHSDGMTAAARHLISLGHRSIALITGPTSVRPSRERIKALRRECRTADVSAVIRSGAFTAAHGETTARALLEQPSAPTAIIAGGNQILIGVLRAFRAMAIRVPEDISLVTCDAVPLADFHRPAIATVARDPRKMGEVAANLLLDSLDGAPASETVLPTLFVGGESCAPPKQRIPSDRPS